MISILLWCWDRQKFIDHTLPKWLEQVGVDFEVVISAGPNIKLIDHPRVRYIIAYPPPKMGANYNALLKAAKGDTLVITQADIEVNDPHQLERMAAMCDDWTMVSEKFFKDGKRVLGTYLQFLMIKKRLVEEVGGWYEAYDCPAVAAHEDTDLMCRLLRKDLSLKFIETPEDKGVYHMHHGTPYSSEQYQLRVRNGNWIYHQRNPEGILALITKQISRHLRDKRHIQLTGMGYDRN
jgi:glycosyltransferase involved in cell wall biosynthesis